MVSMVCIYEDDRFRQFFPLTLLRPVSSLRTGILPLCGRAKRHFNDADICLATRESIAPIVASEHSDMPVNILKRGNESVLFLNGRIRDYADLPELVADARVSTVFVNQDQIVAVFFDRTILSDISSVASPADYQELFESEAGNLARHQTKANLYNYTFELVADVETGITTDYAHLSKSVTMDSQGELMSGASLIEPDNIFVGAGSRVFPTAVIDASHGPVYIAENVRVEPQATIFGPCYIGNDSIVLAGKITGSSIGHTCRVGGEVEESIFQACTNKYHDGFIGHSYIGQWVNFGAMTTNSDLKNNYSPIRVAINGETIDTGSIKVGSFIGDHTKFGIGTLLNTGIHIGACCNLYGGTLIADKEIGSFQWGGPDGYQAYRVDKAIETARVTCGRRGVELSEAEARVLQAIAEDKVDDKGVMAFGECRAKA